MSKERSQAWLKNFREKRGPIPEDKKFPAREKKQQEQRQKNSENNSKTDK